MVELDQVDGRVRRAVEHLVSSHAAARLLGLDAARELLLPRSGRVNDASEQVLPFLFALAESPGYPHAAGVLRRLWEALAALDDPPRSRTRGPAANGPASDGVFSALQRRAPRLLRVARTSRDPEAARTAALMAAHFPHVDAELLPLLVALVSGAPDPQQRAPLLYRLAAAQGHPPHPLTLRALQEPQPRVDGAAVALAWADHHAARLSASHRALAARALQASAENIQETQGWPDPRGCGRRHDPRAAREALRRLTSR